MISPNAIVNPPSDETKTYRIALVGNPNTGKTTLFNNLTGLNQKIGNYPGVTVERKVGKHHHEGHTLEFIDLPGTYSLAAHSLDEMVVTDILLDQQSGENPVDLIVAVVDAGNINRNLYLVSQLFELGKPIVIALNMCDIAASKQISIDSLSLSERFGVPVVSMCASKRSGIDGLSSLIVETLQTGKGIPKQKPDFPAEINQAMSQIRGWIKQNHADEADIEDIIIFRALIDENGSAEKRLIRRYGQEFLDVLKNARKHIDSSQSLTAVEAVIRYQWIAHILKDVVTRPQQPQTTKSDRLDYFFTHRFYGMVIFISIMTLIFQAIYSWAGPLMDGIDGFFGYVGQVITSTVPPGALQSLLVDGVIAGVGGVLIFVPQIAILFLFLGILDDCGYMPRAAFMMDRTLSKCGLSGKSFIPLLSSFACAVPGIMATRTIESKRERFITILIAPLMSCSARLPVYLVLIAAFVPSTVLLGFFNLQALTLLAFYVLGVLVAVPVALLFKRFMKVGESTPFVMEFPSFKWPTPRTVGMYVYERTREFIVRAGTIIFCFAVIIWSLTYFPRPASIAENFDAQRAELASEFQANVSPHLNELEGTTFAGFTEPEEFAEAVVSNERFEGDPESLSDTEQAVAEEIGLYQEELTDINNTENGEYVRASFLGRAGHVIEPFVEPLGWDWRIGMAALASFPARELVVASLGTILNVGADIDEESVSLRQAMVNSKRANGEPLFNLAVALSLMVFFALCAQCISTLAIIKRETNSWLWPVMTFGYMTVLAYFGAMITYQVASAIGLA